MNKNIYIEVKVFGGSEIRESIRDALYFANITGVSVVFVFNGITVYVHPGEDLDEIEMKWKKVLQGAINKMKTLKEIVS